MDTATTIAEEQNTPGSLELLAAQKRMYSEAKRVHFTRIIAVLLLEFAAPFVVLARPEWKEGLELTGGLLALVSALVLNGTESDRVKQAATVQEQFDTQLFRLPWNKALAGRKVAREIIHRAAKAYTGGEAKIRNWYPDPSGAPYPKVALLCQRTNLVWSIRLQKRYATALLVITVLYLLFGLVIGRNEVVPEYLVAIFIPAVPAILEAIETYKRHLRSSQEKEEILAHIEDLLDEVGNSMHPSRLVEECRRIQDAIYLQRSGKPLVPDWWYEIWREKFDADARAAVDDLKRPS
jgi:hypothetical protein